MFATIWTFSGQHLLQSFIGIAKQNWKDLRKTLRSYENLGSLTYLSDGNIGIHSKSRDWLFWMFKMSNINPLMNKSVLFWKDVYTVIAIYKNSRNSISKYEHCSLSLNIIIAPNISSTSTFTRIVQTVLWWFDQM